MISDVSKRVWLAAVLLVLSALTALTALTTEAHEGHDHGEPPPLNLPVAPRVISVTPELELVGVLSGQDQLTIFLHEFATNHPVSGARLAVSVDDDTTDAKPEGDGVFTVQAPWITKGKSVDLIFALTLANGDEDLLTGRLEVPQSLESTMTAAHADDTHHDHAHEDHHLLWAAGGSFIAGVLLTLLVRGRRRTSPDHSDDDNGAGPRQTASALIIGTLLVLTGSDSARAADKQTSALPTIPSSMATDQPQRMPDATLFVPKATQHLLSIRTQVVERTKAAKTVTLSGRVTVGPQNLGRVQPDRPGRFQAVDGRVGYTGLKVEAGEILGYVETYIEAADRANIVSQIAETEARIAKNRAILARFQRSKGAVPQVKLEEVKGELQALTKRRDELLPSTSAKEPLVAPISGVISAARVVVGQVVEPRDILFEIIDPSEFWIEATTAHPEVVNDLASAVAIVHDIYELDLEYLGKGLALRNHATILNFKVLNTVSDIAVGMTARVVLQLKNKTEGIVLPTSAVVRGTNGLPIVWIKTAPERFEPQVVDTEPFDGDSVVIKAGLKPDQRVVTEGVTLLNQVR